jgi:hypothetical protein
MIFGYASEDAPNPGRAAAFHEALLLSGAILHYFKCAVTIIGERGTDKDYQSRYRRFDIPEELKRETDRLGDIRNKWDIAHYKPGWEELEELESYHPDAMTAAQKVLQAYMNWRVKNP